MATARSTAANAGGLRLVSSRRPILTREQLREFSTPRTWREILSMPIPGEVRGPAARVQRGRPSRREAWWRDAVMDADDQGGFGLLTWRRGAALDSHRRSSAPSGWWVLSDEGRAYVGLEAAP